MGHLAQRQCNRPPAPGQGNLLRRRLGDAIIQRVARDAAKVRIGVESVHDKSERCGLDKGTILVEAAIAFDNYLSAEEAVEFGICDKIVPRL